MTRVKRSEFLAREQKMVDDLLASVPTTLAAGRDVVEAIQPAFAELEAMSPSNPMRTLMALKLQEKISQVLLMKANEIGKLSQAAAVVSKPENRVKMRAVRNEIESMLDHVMDLSSRLLEEMEK